MSFFINIHTDRILSPDEIFTALADSGEQLVVTENEFPHLVAGRMNEGLRGVEITEDEHGYTIRIRAFASRGDHELFVATVRTILDLSEGEAFPEDGDLPIADLEEEYGADWIDDQMTTSLSILKTIVTYTGEPLTIFGLFAPMCIGASLLEGVLDEPLAKIEPTPENYETVTKYLTSIQWSLSDKRPTATNLAITNIDPTKDNDRRAALPADAATQDEDEVEERRTLSISAIMIKDNEIVPFDYIKYADLFGIFRLDSTTSNPFLMPFKHLKWIADTEYFKSFDDMQLLRSKDVTLQVIERMEQAGEVFLPDSLFDRPVYPGCGIEGANRTFILRWNPAISSCSVEDVEEWPGKMRTELLNWSVWDYERARMGDKFYLLRVGEGNIGIVGSGVFSSQPWEAPDWSGKGRKTFYMNLDFNFLALPESDKVFPTSELERLLPDFSWNTGHSGVCLSDSEALALEMLWADRLARLEESPDSTGFTLLHP